MPYRSIHKAVWIKIIASLTICGYLSACTTAGNAIPQGGSTMAQVYEDAMQQSDSDTLNAARAQIKNPIINFSQNNLSNYTRTSENEINNLFPQLPNPEIVMYVSPHLAGTDEAPVPGYSTAFTLFDKVHFAL